MFSFEHDLWGSCCKMKPGENILLTEIRNNSLNTIPPSVTNPRADCPALITEVQADNGAAAGTRLSRPPAQALSQHSTHRGLPHLPVGDDLSKPLILSSPCDGCSVYAFKSFLVSATDLRTPGDTFGCSWSWHNFLWTQLLDFISSTKFFIRKLFLFLYALYQGQM